MTHENYRNPKKYTNSEWVSLLKQPADNRGIAQLRSILVKNLIIVLSRKNIRELEQFAEDAVQEGLLNILANIDSFRGESRFLTWAQKIVINKSFEHLRRKHFQNVSIDDCGAKDNGIDGSGKQLDMILHSNSPDLEQVVMHRTYLDKIMTIINEDLTEKQKLALVDNTVYGLNPNTIAQKSGTNRNTIYKRIFDARKKIKNSLRKRRIELYPH